MSPELFLPGAAGTSSGPRQSLPVSLPNISGGTTPHQRSSPHVAPVRAACTRAPPRARSNRPQRQVRRRRQPVVTDLNHACKGEAAQQRNAKGGRQRRHRALR